LTPGTAALWWVPGEGLVFSQSPALELVTGLASVVDEPVSSGLAALYDYAASNLMERATRGYRNAPSEEKQRIERAVVEYEAARRGIEPGTEEYNRLAEEIVSEMRASEGLALSELASRIDPRRGGMIYPSLLSPERRREFEQALSEGVPVEQAEAQFQNPWAELGWELLSGVLLGNLPERALSTALRPLRGLRRVEQADEAVKAVQDVARAGKQVVEDVVDDVALSGLLDEAEDVTAPPDEVVETIAPQATDDLVEEVEASDFLEQLRQASRGESPASQVATEQAPLAIRDETLPARPAGAEQTGPPIVTPVERGAEGVVVTPPEIGTPPQAALSGRQPQPLPGVRQPRPLQPPSQQPQLPGVEPVPALPGKPLPALPKPKWIPRVVDEVFVLPKRVSTVPASTVRDSALSALMNRFRDRDEVFSIVDEVTNRLASRGVDVQSESWSPDTVRAFIDELSQAAGIEAEDLFNVWFRDPRSKVWDDLSTITSWAQRLGRKAREGLLDEGDMRKLRQAISEFVNDVNRLSGGQYALRVSVDSSGVPNRFEIVRRSTGEVIRPPTTFAPPRPRRYNSVDEFLRQIDIGDLPADSRLSRLLEENFNAQRAVQAYRQWRRGMSEFTDAVERVLGRRLTDEELAQIEEAARQWAYRQPTYDLWESASWRMDIANVAAALENGVAITDDVIAGYTFVPGSETYRSADGLVDFLTTLRQRARRRIRESGDTTIAEEYNKLLEQYKDVDGVQRLKPIEIKGVDDVAESSDALASEAVEQAVVEEDDALLKAFNRALEDVGTPVSTTEVKVPSGGRPKFRTRRRKWFPDPRNPKLYRDINTGEIVNPNEKYLRYKPERKPIAYMAWENLPQWAKELGGTFGTKARHIIPKANWPEWIPLEYLVRARELAPRTEVAFYEVYDTFGKHAPAPGDLVWVRSDSIESPVSRWGIVLWVRKRRPGGRLELQVVVPRSDGTITLAEKRVLPANIRVLGNVREQTWDELVEKLIRWRDEGFPEDIPPEAIPTDEFFEITAKAREETFDELRKLAAQIEAEGYPLSDYLRRLVSGEDVTGTPQKVENEVVRAVRPEVGTEPLLDEDISGLKTTYVVRDGSNIVPPIPSSTADRAVNSLLGAKSADDVLQAVEDIRSWVAKAGLLEPDDISDLAKLADPLEGVVDDLTDVFSVFTEAELRTVGDRVRELLQLPRLARASAVARESVEDLPDDLYETLLSIEDLHRMVWVESDNSIVKTLEALGERDSEAKAVLNRVASWYADATVQARNRIPSLASEGDVPGIQDYVYYSPDRVVVPADGGLEFYSSREFIDNVNRVTSGMDDADAVIALRTVKNDFLMEVPVEERTNAVRDIIRLITDRKQTLESELLNVLNDIEAAVETRGVAGALRDAMSKAADDTLKGALKAIAERMFSNVSPQVGRARVDAAAAVFTVPAKGISKAVRVAGYAYTRTSLLRGAVPIIAAGVAYTTPLGDVLVSRDQDGRLTGYLPQYWRGTAARIADTLGIGEGAFEYDQLLNAAVMLFDAIDQTTNITVGAAWFATKAWTGEQTWVGEMITREDLTPHQKWALITALRVSLSGEDAVRRAYEQLEALSPQEVTVQRVEEILDEARNPLLDLVGTMLFDPTDLVNVGTLWKVGTGVGSAVKYAVEGTTPVKAFMDLQEWRMWRAASKYWEEGNPRLWDVLSEKLSNVLYTPEVRAMEAARQFDIAISGRLFGVPITKDNWKRVVEVAFTPDMWPMPQSVRRVVEEAQVNQRGYKAVVAMVQGRISELRPEQVTDEIVDQFVRESISTVARDVAKYVYGANDYRPGSLIGPVLKLAKWQKSVLGRLLLNAFNIGFHVTNTLGDYGTQLQTIGRYMFAPEAEGTLSLASTRAMRNFWRDRLGHIPSIVLEAYSVLGEEESIRLFSNIPVLRNIPGLRNVPVPEAVSALRVYTATFAHWMGILHKKALTELEPVVLDKLGLERAALAELYGQLAGVWRADEAWAIIKQWGDKWDVDQKAMRGIFKVAHTAITRSASAALAAADEARSMTIHQYWRKTVLDQLVEIVFPYQFWFTRSAMRWAEWIANNPSLLSNNIRLERAIMDGLNADTSDPEYLRRRLPLPTSADPWAQEAIEEGAAWLGYDVDASIVTRATDALVLATLPQGWEFDVTEDKVYINIVEKLNPLRNVFAIFGGDEFDPDIPEGAVDGVVEKLITAGGRFPAAYSPLVPLFASGLQRVFGVDTSAVRYVLEPSVPFAQDRVIRGITTSKAFRDFADELGLDVPESGISLDPLWRRVVDLGSGIWTQDAPDYYYKMAARLIAIDVQRGVLSPEEALALIAEQDESNPKYARYFNEAVRYYTGRGAISGLTGILASYRWDGDIRDLASELYELAVVRDSDGNPVIGPDGKPIYDWDRQEVQDFLEANPGIDVLRTSFGEFEERQARAAMTFYYGAASAYTRRQFKLFSSWQLQEAMRRMEDGKATPEDWEILREAMQGRFPTELIDKVVKGKATDIEKVALFKAFREFYDQFTSPDLERQRMEIEAIVDEKVRDRYPDYDRLVAVYYDALDRGDEKLAQRILEREGLRQMFDYRAELLVPKSKFPYTDWEVALNPPSEKQISFAVAVGIDEERARSLPSWALAAEIDRRKVEALHSIRRKYGRSITLDYLEELWEAPRPLLTDREKAIVDDYRDALFRGPVEEVSDSTWEFAIAIGLGRSQARKMSGRQVRQFIDARKRESARTAIEETGFDGTVEDVWKLADLAKERGTIVLNSREKAVVRAYWDNLYVGPRPVTKSTVKLAIDLGMSPQEARTATAEELSDFIERQMAVRRAQAEARRAKFAASAAAAGLSVDAMQGLLDKKDQLKREYGRDYWDYLSPAEAEALRRFYRAYYGARTQDIAWEKALQKVGASDQYIRQLIRRRRGGQRLSPQEYRIYRDFWDYYNIYKNTIEERD